MSSPAADAGNDRVPRLGHGPKLTESSECFGQAAAAHLGDIPSVGKLRLTAECPDTGPSAVSSGQIRMLNRPRPVPISLILVSPTGYTRAARAQGRRR
jgi:hypothetical protein